MTQAPESPDLTAEYEDLYVVNPEAAGQLLSGAPWRRFAALGDSMVEGLLGPSAGYRSSCWADRIHAALAYGNPDVAYLNTGYRNQVSAEVRELQLARVLEFRPDLATVVCGGNDILAPRFDPAVYRDNVDAMVRALKEAGAEVFLYSLMNITAAIPEAVALRPRLRQLNEVTLELARKYETIWVPLWEHPAAGDRNAYSQDKLHMSARGHALIATAAIEGLGRFLATGERAPAPDAAGPAANAAAGAAATAEDSAASAKSGQRPHIARVYDFFLGGVQHSEEEVAVARDAMAVMPGIKLTIWENRKFLKRVARYIANEGITQILDIGSGIPARGNVHSLVHAIDPSISVVYVDIDPLAVARGRELLAGAPHCIAVEGDLTKPHEVLALPEVRKRLDLDRPLGLMFLNVLHFIDPQLVPPAMADYREALTPGSILAISHGTADEEDHSGEITEVYAKAFGHTTMRTRNELRGLFGDFEFVEPGIVQLPDWRPDPSPLSARYAALVGSVNCYAAVAVKPTTRKSEAS